MRNQKDFNQIKDLFNNLEKIESLEILKIFIKELELENSIESFYDKYPQFDFSLTKEDIDHLRKINVIDSEHKLNPQSFPNDTLSKLLAAVLWKKGDINKVQHLVDGITRREGDRTPYSLIFKQYGASLASDSEPIVDQHVLRAFEIYCLTENSNAAVEKIRKKSVYKTRDKPLLDQYRAWFNKVIEKVPDSEKLVFKEKLDKVLFLIGKSLKL